MSCDFDIKETRTPRSVWVRRLAIVYVLLMAELAIFGGFFLQSQKVAENLPEHPKFVHVQDIPMMNIQHYMELMNGGTHLRTPDGEVVWLEYRDFTWGEIRSLGLMLRAA